MLLEKISPSKQPLIKALSAKIDPTTCPVGLIVTLASVLKVPLILPSTCMLPVSEISPVREAPSATIVVAPD